MTYSNLILNLILAFIGYFVFLTGAIVLILLLIV